MLDEIKTLLDMIDRGDVCSLLILIAILACVGGKMVASRPDLKCWGTRLAGGAFVAYLVFGHIRFKVDTVQELIGLTLRGLLAAGLTLGLSWVNLAVSGFINEHLITPTMAKFRREREAARRDTIARQNSESERNNRAHEEERRRKRDRSAQEAATKATAEAEQRAQAQKRNERLRMDCELLWIAYAPVIQQQFGKPDLEAFLARYMGDGHPPEFVEERAAALKTTLTTLYTNAEPTKKYKSIEEAIASFDRAKERIAHEHFEDPAFQEYINIELDKLKGKHLEALIKDLGG